MFHAAKALLYSQRFSEKSHYCLGVALHALFVETGKLSIEFLEAFNNAMLLRESADYKTHFSQSGAKLVVEKAEEFLLKAQEILKEDL
ncbi:HEPN domain-containing protein [Candidatus Aminicenantes bacterium AC-334-K16]|jgi:uncharacterized protein (UPF0332 family)|nr:HEPN domain-containing protein [Candidatus Aminicenantes bacterium AC-334-K16]